MTDGTSQGLFIVVSIVIFGIFVVLAYILFEDTLSPALANMFSTATEQAQLTVQEEITTLDNGWKPYKINRWDIQKIDNGVIYESRENGAGIYVESKHFKPNKTYKISFDMTELAGDIFRIGGHLSDVVETVGITVNGVEYPDTDWANVTPDIKFNQGEAYHVELTINTGEYNSGNRYMYIQPNRHYDIVNGKKLQLGYNKYYKIKIENIMYEEV